MIPVKYERPDVHISTKVKDLRSVLVMSHSISPTLLRESLRAPPTR